MLTPPPPPPPPPTPTFSNGMNGIHPDITEALFEQLTSEFEGKNNYEKEYAGHVDTNQADANAGQTDVHHADVHHADADQADANQAEASDDKNKEVANGASLRPLLAPFKRIASLILPTRPRVSDNQSEQTGVTVGPHGGVRNSAGASSYISPTRGALLTLRIPGVPTATVYDSSPAGGSTSSGVTGPVITGNLYSPPILGDQGFALSASAAGVDGGLEMMICGVCRFIHRSLAHEVKCTFCGTMNPYMHHVGCRYKHLAPTQDDIRPGPTGWNQILEMRDAYRAELSRIEEFCDQIGISINMVQETFYSECQMRKFSPVFRYYRNPSLTRFGGDVEIAGTLISTEGLVYEHRVQARFGLCAKGLKEVMAWPLSFPDGRFIVPETRVLFSQQETPIFGRFSVDDETQEKSGEDDHPESSDLSHLPAGAGGVDVDVAVVPAPGQGSVHDLPADIHPDRVQNLITQAIADAGHENVTINLPANPSETVARAYSEAIVASFGRRMSAPDEKSRSRSPPRGPRAHYRRRSGLRRADIYPPRGKVDSYCPNRDN